MGVTESDTGSASIDRENIKANQNWRARRNFFKWFHPDDGPLERKLILKLDVSILAFACVGFWVLYIDRAIFTNAYVSGLREDLSLLQNQFVQINSIFLVGYAVSIIPLTVLNTRAPPQWVIPICMSVWGLATALGSRAHTFSELAGYRFLVGLGEGAFFPSIQYVFGSWYRPDEIVRRAGLFYVAGSIGTISAGFLASGIFHDLDKSLGRAGWSWMFLISGVITIPIALIGSLFFPGTPGHPNARVFTDAELSLARLRLELVGSKSRKSVTWNRSSLKRFFGRWHFWVLIPWSILFQQGYLAMAQGTYTLWIKSNPQYSTEEVNKLTTIAPCVGIVFIVFYAWVADRYGDRARLPLFGSAHLIAFLGLLPFVIYDDSPVNFKWFGVAASNILNATVPVMYSWANIICANDTEERAFVVSSMLAFAMAFNCWVPLLSMPTVEAPRYFNGYLVCLIMQPVAFAVALLVEYLYKHDQKIIESGRARERESRNIIQEA